MRVGVYRSFQGATHVELAEPQDTLAIRTGPIVEQRAWSLLTKDLPRTYDDPVFADRAIDHIAVPADQAERFSGIDRAPETFGSDHFPIFVTFE